MKEKQTMGNIQNGSFRVQHAYVKAMSDMKKAPTFPDSDRRIALLPASFSTTVKNADRYLKLSKRVCDIPPLAHDMMVVKTAAGKWRLHIPCDVSWTRPKLPLKASHRVVSLDPGVRTFLTGYDPSHLHTFDIGRAQDDLEKIDRGVRDKIDNECSLHDKAREKGQKQEEDNRSRRIRKAMVKSQK